MLYIVINRVQQLSEEVHHAAHKDMPTFCNVRFEDVNMINSTWVKQNYKPINFSMLVPGLSTSYTSSTVDMRNNETLTSFLPIKKLSKGSLFRLVIRQRHM